MNPIKKYCPIPLHRVKIQDSFWSKYLQLIADEVIPYQWSALNDAIPGQEPSHAIKNFRIAAGEERGEFVGMVFQDSDVYKWLEGVAFLLMKNPDQQIEKTADDLIDLIARAQQEDGYINTYFAIKEPGMRWTDLRDKHELYCAGHLIEAAVAYYQATNKTKFLDIARRFADHIDTVFGKESGKKPGYPGHQEIELALVKLFQTTNDRRYFTLSQYFIDERGQKPNYFEQERLNADLTEIWPEKSIMSREIEQSHIPVREQNSAVGHAVRAVYMYCAMADLAAENDDVSLLNSCKTLWNNMVNRRMYLTGGIGSMSVNEGFSLDYDLPNETGYAETCASIGLVFFAHRMLKLEADSKYADIIEKAIYNGIISGIALDGKSFFYANPLEVWPEACELNSTRSHVKPTRQKWFTCACCPPNLARLVLSLGSYIYTQSENIIFTHLYMGNEATIDIAGESVQISQETNYPWSGQVFPPARPGRCEICCLARVCSV